MTNGLRKWLDEIIDTSKRIGRIDLETQTHGYWDHVKKTTKVCTCHMCHEERKLEELLEQQVKEFEVAVTMES